MIMDVADAGTGDGVVHWDIQIFEHQQDNHYLLHEQTIPENTFPVSDITAALSAYSSVEMFDTDHEEVS